MCSVTTLTFAIRALARADVAAKTVVEIGARDVNGAVRPLVESLEPSEYIGVDIEAGPGVDVLCNMEDLVSRFGENRFDVVISTEVLEHVRDWRGAISNLKRVCRPGGHLVLTTRSRGFDYHAFPHDYWRYEPSDMRAIFADCEIEMLESDPGDPGVFLKARKPMAFSEKDLSSYALYAIVPGRPALQAPERQVTALGVMRVRVRDAIRKWTGRRLAGA